MTQSDDWPYEITQLEADAQAAKEYMTRLFKHLAPQCVPKSTLLGLALQLDNYIAGLHSRPPAPPLQMPTSGMMQLCRNHKHYLCGDHESADGGKCLAQSGQCPFDREAKAPGPPSDVAGDT